MTAQIMLRGCACTIAHLVFLAIAGSGTHTAGARSTRRVRVETTYYVVRLYHAPWAVRNAEPSICSNPRHEVHCVRYSTVRDGNPRRECVVRRDGERH